MLRYTLALLAASACSGNALAEPVNINTADAAALKSAIVGVSDARAEMIIDYREKHGPFQSVDDIVLVPGIGTKTLEANRANLTVGELSADASKLPKPEGDKKAKP